MAALLGQFARLKHVKKLGEGTFGEAFKADQAVFKIVPLEGSLLVNGEVQKRSEEILAEVAIALTLSRLRETTGDLPQDPAGLHHRCAKCFDSELGRGEGCEVHQPRLVFQ